MTRRSQRARSPHCARVELRLEPLEERWLPDTTMPPASPLPPPLSFAAAAFTLFWDGAHLIDYQYTGNIEPPFTVYTSGGTFTIPGSYGLADLNASIAFYSQYAGPFAALFLQSGENWEYENLLVGHAEAESF